MATPLFKKYCKRCDRSYLTYENNKEFCNDICEKRMAYEQHFNIKPKQNKMNNCCFCGDETKNKQFCNDFCLKGYKKQKRVENNANVFVTEKKKGKPIPYEVLNKIAEKKRVFEDANWLYRKNRDRI